MQLERWLFRAKLASTTLIQRDPALVRVAGKLPMLRTHLTARLQRQTPGYRQSSFATRKL